MNARIPAFRSLQVILPCSSASTIAASRSFLSTIYNPCVFARFCPKSDILIEKAGEIKPSEHTASGVKIVRDHAYFVGNLSSNNNSSISKKSKPFLTTCRYVKNDIYLNDECINWASRLYGCRARSKPLLFRLRQEQRLDICCGFFKVGKNYLCPHSRPMPTIGTRCHELRIIDGDKNWRIVYRIDTDAIVILEVFQKKTQAIPKSVIDNCKRRIRQYDS